MKLGQTITNIRKEKSMTQEEFGHIFHVTRQTVSNWENEKNYPDLDTLIQMSDMFHISLDVMLKEDKQMVEKLDQEIKFSKNFKRNAIVILVSIVVVLVVSEVGWYSAWNSAKDALETKFNEGVEANEFYFDKRLGYYKKSINEDSYYTLPNQSMPSYFDFVLHFYNSTLDYYTMEDGYSIQILWYGRDEGEKVNYQMSSLKKDGSLDYVLSEEQVKELCNKNPNISSVISEGEQIYYSVYE